MVPHPRVERSEGGDHGGVVAEDAVLEPPLPTHSDVQAQALARTRRDHEVDGGVRLDEDGGLARRNLQPQAPPKNGRYTTRKTSSAISSKEAQPHKVHSGSAAVRARGQAYAL